MFVLFLVCPSFLPFSVPILLLAITSMSAPPPLFYLRRQPHTHTLCFPADFFILAIFCWRGGRDVLDA